MTNPEEGRSYNESAGADQNPFALPEGSTAPSFTDPFELTETLPSPDHQVTEELDLGGQGVFDAPYVDDEPTVDYGSFADTFEAEVVEPVATSVIYDEPAVYEDAEPVDVVEATLVEEFGFDPESTVVEEAVFEPEPTLTDLGAQDPYGYGAQNPYLTPANPYSAAPTLDPYASAEPPPAQAGFDPYAPQTQAQPSPNPEFPQAFAAFDTPQTGYASADPYVAQNPYASQQSYAQQTAWQQPPSNAMQPYQPQPVVGHHQPRSKIAAALLAWFLGHLGVHNFYLGYQRKAVTQLTLAIIGYVTTFILIGFLILPIVYIWGFIEFIMILMGSGGYDVDGDGYPLNN